MSRISHPLILIVIGVLALASPSAGYAAPKPKENAPTEQELKEFASKVVTALIKKDIDGFLKMCEVPFHRPSRYFLKDKDDLRHWITKALDDEPLSQAVNEVKKIETLDAAKAYLSDVEIKSYKEVLADNDFVVHVKTEFGGRKRQMELLIKVKGGKLRLMGWGQSRSE